MSSMYEGIWESDLPCRTKALLHILDKMSWNSGSWPSYETEFLLEPSTEYVAWMLSESPEWVEKELEKLRRAGIYEVGIQDKQLLRIYPDQVICKVRLENMPERGEFKGSETKIPRVVNLQKGGVK